MQCRTMMSNHGAAWHGMAQRGCARGACKAHAAPCWLGTHLSSRLEGVVGTYGTVHTCAHTHASDQQHAANPGTVHGKREGTDRPDQYGQHQACAMHRRPAAGGEEGGGEAPAHRQSLNSITPPPPLPATHTKHAAGNATHGGRSDQGALWAGVGCGGMRRGAIKDCMSANIACTDA